MKVLNTLITGKPRVLFVLQEDKKNFLLTQQNKCPFSGSRAYWFVLQPEERNSKKLLDDIIRLENLKKSLTISKVSIENVGLRENLSMKLYNNFPQQSLKKRNWGKSRNGKIYDPFSIYSSVQTCILYTCKIFILYNFQRIFYFL